ncbi:MAG: histidine phosphatase family protein [Pseudomonadota bacterium]
MTEPAAAPAHYGNATLELITNTLAGDVSRAAVLMRHSAREYRRDIHDMDNPLTDPGREFCRRLGRALPKTLHLRGYHSPAGRCAETTQLVIDTHMARGGGAARVRAVESLGVFYALDQRKMWKAMEPLGLKGLVKAWANQELAADAMIPAATAAELILDATLARLHTSEPANHVDLNVTHDLTLYLLKQQYLGFDPEAVDTEYLDALILFERGGDHWLQSQHGPAQRVELSAP